MLLWGWSFIENKGVRKGREKEKEWGAKTCLPLQKNSGKGERKSGSGQYLSLERPFVSAADTNELLCSELICSELAATEPLAGHGTA